MHYLIKAPSSINGTISLPASKSISNRALILNALAGGQTPPTNLADSDDTQVMVKALTSSSHHIDIGAAGTSMRFLTAYLALQSGAWEITGTDRMKNRPIGLLVNALRGLGATIEYLGKDGYPPLKITGTQLKGGDMEIDGSISSQYLSALMMAGPYMEKGLTLRINGSLVSRPYAEMTLNMMSIFGVKAEWSGAVIQIPAQTYQSVPFTIESDWSAASYWYEMLSLATDGTVYLRGLTKDSFQGDSKVADYFSTLGIATNYAENGVRLTKIPTTSKEFNLDLCNQPDLAQTLAITCALKGIPFQLSGIKSLKIKETDRIKALINEGRKVGFCFRELPGDILAWFGDRCEAQKDVLIETYEDHRMAMSFTPVALTQKTIRINHPEVVSKSYPNFWNDLISIGFTFEKL